MHGSERSRSPEDPWEGRIRAQIRYYEARAREYDEWFERRGRYDRGEEANARWSSEAEEVRRELRALGPVPAVLELAAGTGIWTAELVSRADRVTVVDASAEMLAVHEARLPDRRIERIRADLFSWEPGSRYDLVFFGFWLSHVPPPRFDAFFQMVRRALAPGGRFFLVDSLFTEESTARDHDLARPEAGVQRRRLNDGREFDIVKVFHTPETLSSRLRQLGWRTHLRATETFFLYGSGEPVEPPGAA